jgi:hypothetical protein
VTIVRVGATKKYSDGWESAFGGKRKAKSAAPAPKASPGKKSKASTKKKSAAKKGKKR